MVEPPRAQPGINRCGIGIYRKSNLQNEEAYRLHPCTPLLAVMRPRLIRIEQPRDRPALDAVRTFQAITLGFVLAGCFVPPKSRRALWIRPCVSINLWEGKTNGPEAWRFLAEPSLSGLLQNREVVLKIGALSHESPRTPICNSFRFVGRYASSSANKSTTRTCCA
jgi:hypothetical protein